MDQSFLYFLILKRCLYWIILSWSISAWWGRSRGGRDLSLLPMQFGCPYPQVLHLQTWTTKVQKYIYIFKSHLYGTCADFFLVVIPLTMQYNNYLHSIYDILGVLSYPEMNWSLQEPVCSWYENTTSFYYKEFEHPRICKRVLGPISHG